MEVCALWVISSFHSDPIFVLTKLKKTSTLETSQEFIHSSMKPFTTLALTTMKLFSICFGLLSTRVLWNSFHRFSENSVYALPWRQAITDRLLHSAHKNLCPASGGPPSKPSLEGLLLQLDAFLNCWCPPPTNPSAIQLCSSSV